MVNSGEISPKAENSVKDAITNLTEQYIVGCNEYTRNHGKILPDTATSQ